METQDFIKLINNSSEYYYRKGLDSKFLDMACNFFGYKKTKSGKYIYYKLEGNDYQFFDKGSKMKESLETDLDKFIYKYFSKNKSEKPNKVELFITKFKKDLTVHELKHFCQEEKPTSDFIHAYKMKYDVSYQSQQSKEEYIQLFKKWDLKNVIDKLGLFKMNANIYYKSIGNNQYLIFLILSYENTPKCVCEYFKQTYNSEEEIGTKRYIDPKENLLGNFDLDNEVILK